MPRQNAAGKTSGKLGLQRGKKGKSSKYSLVKLRVLILEVDFQPLESQNR